MFLRTLVGAVAGALVGAGFLVTLYKLPGRTDIAVVAMARTFSKHSDVPFVPVAVLVPRLAYAVAALCTGSGGRRCEA